MADLLFLDTNVLIQALEPAHAVRDSLRQWRAAGERLAVSAIAWSEFRCGPVTDAGLRAWEQLLAGAIAPLDRAIAEQGASLFNATGRRTRSLPDCLIAATAIRHGGRLATLNRADFEPLLAHGLVLA